MSKDKVIAKDTTVSIGLDVDYTGSVVAAIDIQTGELLFEGRITHNEERWRTFLTRLPGCQIWACYETGGIGFHLCRMLLSLGIDCQVVAASKVPHSSEDKQRKNDRRDANALATMYFHPPRSFVRIPTEEEEADRQLVRTRDQLVRNRIRAMQRIKALLSFHNLTPPPGSGGNWSKRYREWLRSCPCRHPLRVCIDALLNELEHLEEQIKTLNKEIVALSRSDHYREKCCRLRSQLSGVGPLTAMTFLLELFRPEEFKTAGAVASHLGLTPCEYSSGGRQRRGHITRWGPPHLRRLLTEATWIWVKHDLKAMQRFEEIRAGKMRKIAIVAMSRRLAIIMWAMTVKEQDYNYRWAA